MVMSSVMGRNALILSLRYGFDIIDILKSKVNLGTLVYDFHTTSV